MFKENVKSNVLYKVFFFWKKKYDKIKYLYVVFEG